VPVLVAGLEHESNTNAALEALQALGHKWQQRAHANSQSQPLLSCTHYEMELTAKAMQHKYDRARTKLLQSGVATKARAARRPLLDAVRQRKGQALSPWGYPLA
jgi:hypothetical protein